MNFFAEMNNHRIQLLLNGVFCDGLPAENNHGLPRHHFWLAPRDLYKPGDETRFVHYGLISLRLNPSAQASTANLCYTIHDQSLYLNEVDTGLILLPVSEEKSAWYTREGGILALDLNHHCTLHCHYCARSQSTARARWLATKTEAQVLTEFMVDNGLSNLSPIKQISIVTGRFASETKCAAHIYAVLQNAIEYGFTGDLYIATSQITQESTMQAIAKMTPGSVYFAYTLEVFARPELSPQKTSHNMAQHQKILSQAHGIFGRAYYNCIAGLDTLYEFKKGIEALSKVATPYVSIFSVYRAEQFGLYVPGARTLEYYLDLQQFLLGMFGDRIYMHDHPVYNASNRALLPFPERIYLKDGLWM